MKKFSERIMAELDPVGEVELSYATMIAGYLWRLHRAARIEAGILSWAYYDGLLRQVGQKVAELKAADW